MYDLERFVAAQAPVHDVARSELVAGRKRTHWMWFVFPQLSGLGASAMAQRYALASLDAAEAYLKHPVLGPRLVEDVELVNKIEGRSIHEIFGSPDDMKFHSCVTLFAAVRGAPASFSNALAKYFGGTGDPRTLAMLAGKKTAP